MVIPMIITIWLFNMAMENNHAIIGKPPISMGHLYHGYVSHNQMVILDDHWSKSH